VQFLDVIVSADDIQDDQKARICKKLGETDKVCPTKITVLQLSHVHPFLASHDLYSSEGKPRFFFFHMTCSEIIMMFQPAILELHVFIL